MTLAVQITIITLGIVMLCAVVFSSVQKKITESHALLWLIPCLCIIIGGIFPQITYFLSDLFRTQYPPAIVFAIAIILVYLILFQCFKILSVQGTKNKELASRVALLEKQLENLTAELDTLNSTSDSDNNNDKVSQD